LPLTSQVAAGLPAAWSRHGPGPSGRRRRSRSSAPVRNRPWTGVGLIFTGGHDPRLPRHGQYHPAGHQRPRRSR